MVSLQRKSRLNNPDSENLTKQGTDAIYDKKELKKLPNFTKYRQMFL
jgi:hypothetical protein